MNLSASSSSSAPTPRIIDIPESNEKILLITAGKRSGMSLSAAYYAQSSLGLLRKTEKDGPGS